MPVTLNPPPFPTPDNNKVNAADKTADAHDGPTDAFSALLTAAGDAPVDPTNGGTTTRPGPDVTTVAGNVDATFSPRGLARGSGHKLPVIILPIDGLDTAAPVRGIKPGATPGLATDKLDPDRKDSDDTATTSTTSATDLAGMSAMLSALLSPADRAATLEGGKSGTKLDALGAADAAGAGAVGNGDARPGSASASSKADASLTNTLLQGMAQDARASATLNAGAIATAAKVDASDRSDQADLRVARALDADALRASTAAVSAGSAVALTGTASREDVANAKPGGDKSDAIASTSTPPPATLFQHDVTLQRADTVAIATPVTAPGWQGEFAEKLGQIIMTGSDRAEFRVHPANMGPVEVRITVNADQASIMITAPHATTRDALEQALPQLRDLLANQGITLGQANVQSEHRPSDQAPRSRDLAPAVDVSAVADITVRTVRSIGLVDTFA